MMQQHIKNKLSRIGKCGPGVKLIPSISAICLLGLGILCLNPPVNADHAFAEGSVENAGDNDISLQAEAPDASISFIMTNSDNETIDDGGTVTTETKLNELSFIDTNIKITTSKIKQFHVAVQSVDNNTSLVGELTNNTITAISNGMLPTSFNDDAWGYTIAETNSNNATNTYSPLPASSDSNTKYSSTLNPTDGEHHLKLSFAAKTNMYTPSDHYKITTIVSVVAQAKELIDYSLSYNANGGVNPPSLQTASSVAESQTFTIASQGGMAREGYSFLGWSANQNSTTAEYTAGSTITLTNVAPTKTLYAVWKEDIKTLKDIVYMQDMTSDICSASAEQETKQLIDKRDNKYYWVAKLKDCWMTQNLDFDVPAALNSTTSNITSVNITTNTSRVYYPSGWPSTGDTYNGYYDPGDYMYNGPDNSHAQGTQCDIKGGGTFSSCGQFATATANTEAFGDINAHYHVGNYYSWSAATAKSGDNLSTDDNKAPDSVCPKGWQLPTGGYGQFYQLLGRYGVSNTVTGSRYTLYGTPLYFVYGGNLYASTLNYAGSNGFYWSSTADSNVKTYALAFHSIVSFTYSYNRYIGLPIRCVAE